MTSMEDRIAAALAKAFGKGRIPDVVDIEIGQDQADAIEAQHGRPIWTLKWARPFEAPATLLTSRVSEWSLPGYIEPVTINLHLSNDPDRCRVIRRR